ncbi:antA/AntB antirepressor family protein [Delftia acidovorans]|uniref:antA/AntB antirepressor family protein n=1 Tax=Delftia acidovorans TaxID=80866 RepID=UPI003340AB6A
MNIPINENQIDGESIKTCDGRQLHVELGVSKDYTTWAKAQIKRARLVENRDYLLTQEGEQLTSGTKWKSVYHFSVDAAKHIAMMSGTDRGHEVREYFIACERVAKGLPPKARIPYAIGKADTLTLAEQNELLTQGAEALPEKQRGSFLLRGWSKLKAHFRVSYREIPRSEFTEALAIASRHVAEIAPVIEAPRAVPTESALGQAMGSMHLMAEAVANMAAAVLNLSRNASAHLEKSEGLNGSNRQSFGEAPAAATARAS